MITVTLMATDYEYDDDVSLEDLTEVLDGDFDIE